MQPKSAQIQSLSATRTVNGKQTEIKILTFE